MALLSRRILLINNFLTHLKIYHFLQYFPGNPNITKLVGMTLYWFRLFPFRSPLLWESLLFSFPAVTEMFHFTALALTALYIQAAVSIHYDREVIPFGNPRIDGCLHLPEAYRSLPRPSSPSYAKASTKCP